VSRTFTSPGGSVSVRTDGTTITVLSVVPADGWQVDDKHTLPTEVDVTFVTSGRESHLRIQLVNGQLRQSYDD
jgi:hypothetical protein